MQFVAIDLETTGLNPHTDTIIEVAAIRFELESDENGVWTSIKQEERSMLINPLREIRDEVTLITGITESMLRDKPLWSEVKEKVKDFIGDAIIVGHNVLFDIAMLREHDINLEKNQILDTFELAEIFSQEASSLNLGFLSKSYAISAGDKEHRALGDTRLSVGLFIHYLNSFREINQNETHILTLCAQKEEKPNITIFLEILGVNREGEYTLPNIFSKYEKYDIENGLDSQFSERVILKISHVNDVDIPLEESEEYDMLVSSKKGEAFLYEYVRSLQKSRQEDSVSIFHDASEYISREALEEYISEPIWKRKYTIFMAKILFWLEKTGTGKLDELKYYGDEYKEVEFLRGETGENVSQIDQKIQGKKRIFSFLSYLKNYTHIKKSSKILIKDIALFEESMRKFLSISLHWKELYEIFHGEHEILESLGLLEGLLVSLPERPTGPHDTPPGEYGETYILSESDVWHLGNTWLSLVRLKLEKAFFEWKERKQPKTRKERKIQEKGEKYIHALIDFLLWKKGKTLILSIKDGDTTTTIVPKSVEHDMKKFFEYHSRSTITGISLGNEGDFISNFLKGTYDEKVWKYEPINTSNSSKKELQCEEPYAHKISGGTIIVTTSQKDAREIGKNLEKTGYTIYIQGISGGKSKIKSLFLKEREKSIIVGTLENWQEEYDILTSVREVIIVKMPFDPPSDPYFIARTSGMRNNFELYSIPMVIQKINSLIAHVRESQNPCPIFCWDTRLTGTEWGKKILKEIL